MTKNFSSNYYESLFHLLNNKFGENFIIGIDLHPFKPAYVLTIRPRRDSSIIDIMFFLEENSFKFDAIKKDSFYIIDLKSKNTNVENISEVIL